MKNLYEQVEEIKKINFNTILSGEIEAIEAATRVIRDAQNMFASGSYIIIHHDVETNEINSDWLMCYDENNGPIQIKEKLKEYIADIYEEKMKGK